ncbi:spore protease YyaC [Anaerosporobacter faecicola]|uniref:spore protease YyaC n=1 Tax=Anaerosporobacter faecicola TaxID=2718714 RepID=UPI001EE55B1B|nr:spore protease YyaC [Anaerosporobacter faecicola]
MITQQKSKKKVYYFNSADGYCAYQFSQALSELIRSIDKTSREIVFLCIGSDRATGDSLGPIIGYKLSELKYKNYTIYGTLDEPVHAKNLKETITKIKTLHRNSIIIAIDASLGKSNHVGFITLGEGPLKPGAGVAKDLPAVGDVFITGIVNFSGLLDNMLLQTTRLNVVMKLADCICLGIRFCLPLRTN